MPAHAAELIMFTGIVQDVGQVTAREMRGVDARRIDAASCRVIMAELPEKLRRVHALEEMILFPAVEDQRAGEDRGALIARLRAEHDQDDRAAIELVRVLRAVLDNRASLNWDAIGYMLRGFFETVRRHVATERLLLWRHG